jgi:4-carboxymuconolactone decarboxylase
MKTRIRSSNVSDWSDETRALLSATTPAAESADGTGPPNILYTIAHHPSLLPPFLGFAGALALQGVLPRREAELLALRAAWNCRSAFEWGHHVEYGLAHGLTQEEIRNVPVGPEAAIWNPQDRTLLECADELAAQQQVQDQTFEALRLIWSDAEIVEIVFIVGNYTMLSMLANATGVPVEERLPGLPSETRSSETP